MDMVLDILAGDKTELILMPARLNPIVIERGDLKNLRDSSPILDNIVTTYYYTQFRFKVGDWWATRAQSKASEHAFDVWWNTSPRHHLRRIRRLSFIVYPQGRPALPGNPNQRRFCFGNDMQGHNLRYFANKIRARFSNLTSMIFEIDYTATDNDLLGGQIVHVPIQMWVLDLNLQDMLQRICLIPTIATVSVLDNSIAPMGQSVAGLRALNPNGFPGDQALQIQSATTVPTRSWDINGV
jgi:hypothetical protein